jgi:hypothetical protein
MDHNKSKNNPNLINLNQPDEEVLEISSTGYGLESSTQKNDKVSRNNNAPSCGGL